MDVLRSMSEHLSVEVIFLVGLSLTLPKQFFLVFFYVSEAVVVAGVERCDRYTH